MLRSQSLVTWGRADSVHILLLSPSCNHASLFCTHTWKNLVLIKLPNHIQAKRVSTVTKWAFLTKVRIANKRALMAPMNRQLNCTQTIPGSALRTSLWRHYMPNIVAYVASANISPIFLQVVEDTVHGDSLPCIKKPEQRVPSNTKRACLAETGEVVSECLSTSRGPCLFHCYQANKIAAGNPAAS